MPARTLAKPRPTGLDPRVERSRTVILEAAVELISEESFAACTIDALVKRTGVARATIYRHWPSRELLIKDVIDGLCEVDPVADTGSLVSDVTTFVVTQTRAREQSPISRRLQTLTGLFEAVRREPNFAALSSKFLEEMVNALRTILRRAEARGELQAGADIDALADMLLGALVVRKGFTNRRASDKYIARLVAALVRR